MSGLLFPPDAQVYSVGDEDIRQTALRTWWTAPPGEPAADEADRHRRIVSVGVSGTVATAKLELGCPGVFHDDMTLAKAGGRWQIVTKGVRGVPPGRVAVAPPDERGGAAGGEAADVLAVFP